MVHCRTQTYNFNVISTDSDPSFGVSNKALGSGKSPGKAHLEEVTDCGSIKRRRKPLCEQHQVKEDFLFLFFSVQTSWKICVYFLCHHKGYDLLFSTFQPVIILSNGVSLITAAAV